MSEVRDRLRAMRKRSWSPAERELMAIRRLAVGHRGMEKLEPRRIRGAGVSTEDVDVAILKVPLGRNGLKRGPKQYAVVGTRTNGYRNPATMIANSITRALDPKTAPGKVKSLKDMTPEEQAKMRALYDKPAKK